MTERASSPSDEAILAPWRRRIDALDEEIVRLLAERFAVVDEVAAAKGRSGIAVVLPDRIADVHDRIARAARAAGLDPGVARRIYEVIIAEACARERRRLAARRGGD